MTCYPQLQYNQVAKFMVDTYYLDGDSAALPSGSKRRLEGDQLADLRNRYVSTSARQGIVLVAQMEGAKDIGAALLPRLRPLAHIHARRPIPPPHLHFGFRGRVQSAVGSSSVSRFLADAPGIPSPTPRPFVSRVYTIPFEAGRLVSNSMNPSVQMPQTAVLPFQSPLSSPTGGLKWPWTIQRLMAGGPPPCWATSPFPRSCEAKGRGNQSSHALLALRPCCRSPARPPWPSPVPSRLLLWAPICLHQFSTSEASAASPLSAPCTNRTCCHRRIGRKLIAEAEEICRDEWGFQEIWLGVQAKNRRALSLYKKLGYKTRFRMEEPLFQVKDGKVVESASDNVYMRKSLRAGLVGAIENAPWSSMTAVGIAVAVAAAASGSGTAPSQLLDAVLLNRFGN